MYTASVILKYYAHTHPKEMEITVDVDDFYGLKQEFLKRFGNLRQINRLERQKSEVKRITKNANTVREWTDEIALQTDYELIVQKEKRR